MCMCPPWWGACAPLSRQATTEICTAAAQQPPAPRRPEQRSDATWSPGHHMHAWHSRRADQRKCDAWGAGWGGNGSSLRSPLVPTTPPPPAAHHTPEHVFETCTSLDQAHAAAVRHQVTRYAKDGLAGSGDNLTTIDLARAALPRRVSRCKTHSKRDGMPLGECTLHGLALCSKL